MKKITLFVFAFLLTTLLAAFPAEARAAEILESGTCGDNLTWTLTKDGVLTISGNGDMEDFGYDAPLPWYDIKTVIISDGVTSIGNYAFKDCGTLTSITIGRNVQRIGSYAFRGCRRLSEVRIFDVAAWCGISFEFPFANPITNAALYLNDTLVTDLMIPRNVRIISPYAFSECTSLRRVVISEGVTEIGDIAFASCENLSEIELPDSIIKIGDSAFRNTSISSIHLGENVTLIDAAAFQHCQFLKSVVVPDSVESIGNGAFFGCIGLTDITLGSGITSIGANAFRQCDALWHVLYRGTTQQWDTITLGASNDSLSAAIRHDNITGNEQIDASNQSCAICACDHQWDDGAVTKEATCKENGMTSYICTLCQYIKTEAIAKLTEHTPGAPATATTDQTCTVCGEVLQKATGETEPTTLPTTGPVTAPAEPAVDNAPQNDFTWVFIPAVILIGAAAVGFIIWKKKK